LEGTVLDAVIFGRRGLVVLNNSAPIAAGETIEPDSPTAGILPDTRSHPVSSIASNDQQFHTNRE
jgi:hypothetical protein